MGAADSVGSVKMHVSLNVSDVERSVRFYRAFFGAEPHKIRPGYANFDLDAPPLKLALNEHPEGARKGALSHLGLQVATAADVETARRRLQEAGLATFDERDSTCCYARQDKVWAHDPDGNAWEVYVITDDLLDDHEHDHPGNPLTDAGLIAPTALSVPAAGRAGVRCCPEM